MATKKSDEKATKRLGMAPTDWKKVDTTGIGGGKGTPWDFAMDAVCIGVLKSVERRPVKGFDGGPARTKCIAVADVENTVTGEAETYAMFLPDGYERAFRGLVGRWVRVERLGFGYDTRFDIQHG